MNLIKTWNNITFILLINYMYCCPCLRLRAHLSSRDYITFDLQLSFNVIGLSMCYVCPSLVCHYTSNKISLMEFKDITYFLTKLAKIAVHLTIFILSFLSSL